MKSGGPMQPTRRAFLKTSGGLVLSLPLLPSLARAQVAEGPPRFVVFWESGGTLNNRTTEFHYDAMHPWNDWRPGGPPDAPVLGPIHDSLRPHADRLLFLSGVDNAAEPAEHQRADVSSLTAARALDAPGGPTAGGPSIDQVVARRLSERWPVPFPSVDLAVAGPTFGEPSYLAAAAPIAREPDPRAAFARLFGGLDVGANAAELARLRAQRRSVLDGALAGFRLLDAQLGEADRRVLQAHQTHLREIERRLEALESIVPEAACAPPEVGAIGGWGPSADWGAAHPDFRRLIAPLQVDVMAQALICGLTHVATLYLPDTIEAFLPTPFQALAAQPSGHALGHVAHDLGDPAAPYAQAWRAEVQANRAWKAAQVARLLDLFAPHEGLLDRTLVLHLSEFSNAAQHVARDLPIMLAGNAGGLRTGRHLTFSEGGRGDTLETHVDYKSSWSLHNVFTLILRQLGFDDPHFGDDTATYRGPLPV